MVLSNAHFESLGPPVLDRNALQLLEPPHTNPYEGGVGGAEPRNSPYPDLWRIPEKLKVTDGKPNGDVTMSTWRTVAAAR